MNYASTIRARAAKLKVSTAPYLLVYKDKDDKPVSEPIQVFKAWYDTSRVLHATCVVIRLSDGHIMFRMGLDAAQAVALANKGGLVL